MENLDLYEKLQPLFGEKMGPLRSEDTYICEFCRIRIVHDEDNAHDCCGREPNNDLRLPLPIDSDGPDGKPSARCLWGMVDWKRYHIIRSSAGELTICDENNFVVSSGTPTEALLRALIAQEGL